MCHLINHSKVPVEIRKKVTEDQMEGEKILTENGRISKICWTTGSSITKQKLRLVE